MAKGMRVKLNYHVSRDPDTGAEVTRLTPGGHLSSQLLLSEVLFNDGSHLLFAGEFDGHWNYYLLNIASAEAVQLTEGAGDNTFGGFLSPDDKSLYYVKNDRTLLEVNLTTLAEREVYRVSEEWVGYGTWVANSDCSKLVGIEIAKSDWTPLNDWQIFHDFFHKGPHCRLLRVDLRSGESQVIHEEKSGWDIRSIVPSTTIPSPSAMKGRTIWLTPACGWSMKMAATCVKSKRMPRAKAAPMNSGYRTVQR